MKKIFNLCLAFTILFAAFSSAASAQGNIPTLSGSPASLQPDTQNLYMPAILQCYPNLNTVGAEVSASSSLAGMLDIGMKWIRIDKIDWQKIEPVRTDPPTYLWDRATEDFLASASRKGIVVIANLRHTPAWAQKYPGWACGPVSESSMGAFAQFLRAVVIHYGAEPYKVKYWEIANEPDIDHTIIGGDSPFGCWGDGKDEYYGGGYYADVLKSAYPAIKSIDPVAKVLFGGLLLDCDPTNPPPNNTCKSAKFFEGALRNGGGPYFDIVSFHGYNQYIGSLSLDEHYPSWDKRGGVVLGKISYIREVLNNYGFKKPIIDTEGSLLCSERSTDWCNPPGDAFYQAQADYVVWLYVRNIAAGIQATIWYQYESGSWRYSGLLDSTGKSTPAYQAIKFLNKELGSSTFRSEKKIFDGVRIYEFGLPDRWIWVMWAPDEKPHAITIPGNIIKVWDKYGSAVAWSNNQLVVSSPIYVEFTP